MKSPMDIEMELNWKKERERKPPKPDQFSYITPVKKRRVDTSLDIDCTAIVAQRNPPLTRSLKNLSNLPYVGIGYLHLLLNIVVIFIIIYGTVSLALFLRSDIQSRIIDRKMFLRNMIEVSKNNYELNRCDPRTRVPAMNTKCTEWEIVMSKKMSSVELTKIVVEVFGEACDGFITKISLKGCILGAVFFVLFLLFRNSRLGGG